MNNSIFENIINQNNFINQATILIVDDNEANQLFLTDLISMFGYTPINAHNGLEALEKIKAALPDVILLDIMMPKMNGFEVIEELKDMDLLSNIPVIVISAIDDMNSIVKCLEQGAIDYLIKPFQATILKARIINCLEKKHRIEQEKLIHKNLESSYNTLKEIENLRNNLASMIVHDLNNPLSIIQGYTQYISMKLRKENISTNEIIKNLKKIATAASNMEELIKGILDVSKIESQKMELNESIFNIVEITKNIYEHYVFEKSDIRNFEFKTNEEIIIIKADKSLLTRIIQNLVSNAIKHSKETTTIMIEIKKINEIVHIMVKDNGYGIKEELLPKIFEKYAQLNNNNDQKPYGVGLGLYFCKIATDAMNGKIWVESKIDEGSTFFIELPVIQTKKENFNIQI